MDPNYPSRLNDYLHFPESDDDTDSDFDPEDYATSEDDDEFEDSAEEDEDDLSHLDPANVITAGLYPHERGFKVPPKSAIVPTENKETPATTRDLKEYLKPP
jgi:hypothetical protein|tara:strand:- start:826 stop:1131 length:306 start_codon:yes stop_codon:yes gene_type:complete